MTVLPFTTRESIRKGDVAHAGPDVTGRFRAPGGDYGSFIGSYRLERLLDQYGQSCAAGVFSGELLGADHRRIGLASRRHVAAAEITDDPYSRYVGLGPVDVNLLGILVSMDAFTMTVPLGLPATGFAGSHLRSTAELLGRVAAAAGSSHLSRDPWVDRRR